MSDGMSIRKILSPIISPSRVNAAGRQNPDSRGKRFKKHFEDENDESAGEDAGDVPERSEQAKGAEKTPDVSGTEGPMKLLKGGLGKKIDIRA